MRPVLHLGDPIRRLGLAAAMVLLVAACSGTAATATPAAPASASAVPPTAAPPTATASASAPASEAPSSAGSTVYDVKAATGSVGAYLTGDGEMTLYVFKKDTNGTSACSGGCATNWPPFTLDAGASVKAGAGVGGTFATIKRDDGKTQVTYGGAPLYYFAGDAKPGDTTGQGLNNVWFVAAP